MSRVKSRTFIPGVGEDVEDILEIVDNTTGNTYYVSTSGSDSNDGLTWATAFKTIIYAVSQCTPLNGDRIYLADGTYDETANKSTGVNCNVAAITISGVGSAPSDVVIQNTNSDKAGSVFTITAIAVTLRNLYVKKNDGTTNENIKILVDGASLCILDDVVIEVEHEDATGIKYTGTASACIYKGGLKNQSIIFSNLGVGTGIDFDDCTHMLVQDANLLVLETGVKLRADAHNVVLKGSMGIENVTTGIHLYSGASNNVLDCLIANATTNIIDNSGNATNNPGSSLTHIHQSIERIRKFTGTIWFVDALDGLDTNSGENPLSAFATIGNAINTASEGDAITVKSGDYYETGLNLNLIGLELWGEIGVTIYNATGTGLTVSARDCRVEEIIIVAPGQIGLDLQGNYCVIESVTPSQTAIGVSLSGRANRLRDIIIGSPTVTGIDISGPYNQIKGAFVSNNLVAARGIYLSSSSAILNLLEDCNTMGNTISGFETVLGADLNSFIQCSSGGGDGKRLDLGYHNLWDILEQLTTEHNEQMHPISDGEGTAGRPVTVDNTATDDTPDTRSDRNYWGDTVAIILPDLFPTFWNSIGIYVFATTANKICQWQIWFPNAKFTTTRNGGLAWDLGQTVITVTDASLFLEDDLIWMRSTSHPNGEILEITNIAGNVLTVASETRFSGNTGIRYNHVAGEAIYLIGRTTDDQFTSIEGGYSAGSAKESSREIWHIKKELPRNSAMIIRMLNTLDNLDASFEVAALYEM